MPVFGEYETNDEPLAVTPARNQTTTVWLARKSGAQDGRQFAIKCLAVHRDERTHASDETLGADPGLEFIETVKQLKKAQAEGSRDFLPIHAFGTSDSGFWYAADYCARGSLKTWINLRGGVDSAALHHLVASLAEGCKSLRGICGRSHGNIKPSNVLLQGKSRPLKSTPLLMADAMPVSTSRVSGMAADNRMMVQNIFEAQDLRAIGELILQLVEGRLIESGSDYNFPVESSPEWHKLGKDEKRWRGLCNRLIDPQLDLAKTNLDWLAKQHRAGINPQVILVPAAAVLVIGAAGAAVYLYAAGGFARHVHAADTARNDGDWITAAQEIGKALKMRPNDPQALDLSGKIFANLEQAAQKEVAAGNWNTAQQDIDQANTLKPNDPGMARVDQKLQRGKAYQGAMDAGQQAFENKNYDEAIRQAKVAMDNSPQDTAAEQLQADSENAKKAIEMQESGARDQGYAVAMSAAHTALAGKNYDAAIRQADTALVYKPDDADASRLKSEAQNARDAAAAKLTQARQAYEMAMQAGHKALEANNYNEAISQAGIALENEPGDADATHLKTVAESQEAATAAAQAQASADAQARLQKYQDAMAAGQSALSNQQFDEAIRQADLALTNRPGDSAATQLKADAVAAQLQQRNYEAAIAAARDALRKNDYDTAIAQAKVALQNKADDPDATQIESNAEAGAKAARDAATRKQNYDAAMAAGHVAYSKAQYKDAIQDAETALDNEPGDSPATQLKSDAQAQQEKIDEALARQQRYDNAITDGNAAISAGKYQQAIQQAQIALGVKPGDAPATKLQADAQAGLFNQYITAGNTDLAKGNYKEAMQYAQAALKLKEDPGAHALEAEAESEEKTLTDLDAKLGILMKYFGVDQPGGSSILPDAKATKITEIDDRSYVARCLVLTTNLEAQYVKGGWIELEKRRDILQHIRQNLNNY